MGISGNLGIKMWGFFLPGTFGKKNWFQNLKLSTMSKQMVADIFAKFVKESMLMYFCTTTITQTTESSQVRKNESNELIKIKKCS